MTERTLRKLSWPVTVFALFLLAGGSYITAGGNTKDGAKLIAAAIAVAILAVFLHHRYPSKPQGK